MTPPIRLLLAAAPCCEVAGRRLPLPASDALLLAWLALEGPTPRERLASLLWPASDAEAARNALRQRLFRLRRQCGVDLVAGTGLLALADGVVHDLHAAPGDDAGASPATLLAGLGAAESPELDAWLAERRARLAAGARAAQLQRIAALEAAGDPAGALPLALALVEVDPLSEDAHRRLMRLQYLAGDRAAALLAFDRCERLLKDEVGTAPSAETLALLRTITQENVGADIAAAGTARRGALPASVLRPPRLVGREAERQALARGIAAGHVVVLLGEAGMGKSRLLQALAAQRAGVLHVSGRPGDALVPYATLTRALRALLERDPAAADAALQRALAPLLPELPEAAALQPGAAATSPLAQPVRRLLQRAGRGLEVIALDDLHFADDATVELLHQLLAVPRDDDVGGSGATAALAAPRWCLGMRPPPPGSRLQALLDAIAAAGPHTRLALQPLTEAQMAEFVDSLALPGVSGAALAPVLHQRSGGNPLFALETLKLLWADGADAAAAAELPRPASLAQLIGQQLARLSREALQLARIAAIAGVDFGIPLAEALLGRNALDLADAWAELEAQQVLRGAGFAHDLIHDAVLQGLPEVIARHLHGQVAAWLEAVAARHAAAAPGGDAGSVGAAGPAAPGPARESLAEPAPEPARIAAHWEAAGQRGRALPALRAAAERAHRALRETERIGFLLRAADIAEGSGTEAGRDEAFELVRGAVEAHMNTIRQADGLPLLDRAAALARTPLQAARVAADRAWYAAVLGDLPGAITLGEAALAQAGPLGDAALTATVREHLGTALSLAGRFDAALAQMQAAAPDIERHAGANALSAFHGNFAVVLDNLGRPADAEPRHREALRLSQVHGDQAQHATQLANFAASRLDAGDVAGAALQAAAAQRIVTTFEMTGSSAGYIATLMAQCERARGRYGEALAWCDRAEAILGERNPARVPVARLHRAHVWLDLGQHARARQVLHDGLDTALAMPARYAVRWLLLLARLQRRLGRATEASESLARAAALAPADGWPELGLLVGTEQALAEPPAAARRALLAIADEAAARTLHGAELGALLHAGCCAPPAAADPPADPDGPAPTPAADAALAARILALAERAEALHADRALRWLAPATLLVRAGEVDRARAVADAGRDWLRSAAAAHLAPEFAPGFLQQHPANVALMAWR